MQFLGYPLLYYPDALLYCLLYCLILTIQLLYDLNGNQQRSPPWSQDPSAFSGMILTTSYKSCKHILEIGKEIQRQQLGPFDILRSGNSSFSWKTSIETNGSGGAESIVSPCAPADWTAIGTGDPIATLVQLQKLCKIKFCPSQWG